MQKGVLVILDGYGEDKDYEFNAVTKAKSPFLNNLKKGSCSLLKTDGESVGLFKGDMGGSEVGHTTIGAGRVVMSTAKKFEEDIKQKSIQNNKTFQTMLKNLEAKNANLHLVGMLSDKKIHSNIFNAIEIVKLVKDKAKNIFLHLITDGRDCGVHDSLKYLNIVKNQIKSIKNCQIASISGRFYAMDRENNMDRIDLAVDKMFSLNETDMEAKTYIENQHNQNITDEFILPCRVKCSNFELEKDDIIFFFNYREDRLREIVEKVLKIHKNVVTVIKVADLKTKTIYSSKNVEHTLSEHLSQLNLRQMKISESTKYAHITYFLNGGRELAFKNEDRIHIPTIKTKNFALTPFMRAKEITNKLIESMKNNYDAIIVNYSNPDMVGHTGDFKATKKAIEFIDKCLNKAYKVAKKQDYFMLITADHGNSENMRDENNNPITSHTLNRVFCAVANSDVKLKKHGELSDVAPTFLDLLQVEPNKYFTGSSLLK